MNIRTTLLTLTILFAAQTMLFAHGVQYTVSRENTVVVHASYSSGEPMAYAEIKIYSPGDADIEYQNGRTDRHGVFAFFPDTKGEWTIRADDGAGHGFTARVDVEEIKDIPMIEGALTPVQKFIVGLATAWGFLGFFFYFRSRRL